VLRKTQPPQCAWELVGKQVEREVQWKVESGKWKANAKCKNFSCYQYTGIPLQSAFSQDSKSLSIDRGLIFTALAKA